MPPVIDAMLHNDREAAIALLTQARSAAGGAPPGARLNLVTTPAVALLRVWNPTSHGDDVSPRRRTVTDATRTGRLQQGLEAGQRDISVFGVAPIIHEGRTIGALDVAFGINEVVLRRLAAAIGVEVSLFRPADGGLSPVGSTIAGAPKLAAALHEAAMEKLAAGDVAVAVEGAGRHDEIGEMAAAADVFRNDRIEARRLREAGKGFAVVASEVKNLAAQTAKATEEIARTVEEMQGATRAAVETIGEIGNVIGRMDGVTASIAAAIEEQGAATAEISRAVQQAAAGTQVVTTTIGAVSTAAGRTGAHSTTVRTAAAALRTEAKALTDDVARFLAEVRRPARGNDQIAPRGVAGSARAIPAISSLRANHTPG